MMSELIAERDERIARLEMELDEARAEIETLREQVGGTVRFSIVALFRFSRLFRALPRRAPQ